MVARRRAVAGIEPVEPAAITGALRGGEAARFRRDQPVAALRRLDRAAFGEDRRPVSPRDLQKLQRDLPILIEMIRHHGVEALPRHLARRHVVDAAAQDRRRARAPPTGGARRAAARRRRAPVLSPRHGRAAPAESAAPGRRARAAGRARPRRRRRSPCRRRRARPRRCRRSARCAAAAPRRPRARRGTRRARAGRRGGSAGRWWSRQEPSGSAPNSPSESRPSLSAPMSAGRNGTDGGMVKTRGFMAWRSGDSVAGRTHRQIFAPLSPTSVVGGASPPLQLRGEAGSMMPKYFVRDGNIGRQIDVGAEP